MFDMKWFVGYLNIDVSHLNMTYYFPNTQILNMKLIIGYIHFASYHGIIILSNWNVDRMWVSLFHAFNLHHEAWYHFDDDQDKEEQQTSFCGTNTRIINKAKNDDGSPSH